MQSMHAVCGVRGNLSEWASVQVWDWDKYKYDDYIGEALIPTAPLVDAFRPGHSEFSNSNWYELYDKKGQLCTLGKIDRKCSVKTEHNVPARWVDLVPAFASFTVEALLRAMVLGLIKPLYDSQGKHACAAPDE